MPEYPTNAWSRALVFLDTETGGLDREESAPWEIAMMRRERTGEEHRVLIHVSDFDVEKADPEALAMNGFADRWMKDPRAKQMTEDEATRAVWRGTAGATVVCAVPTFDLPMIETRMRLYGRKPKWHYRTKCVEVLTEGLLGVEMYGLAKCADALGIEYDPATLHGAAADVELTIKVWDTVWSRVREERKDA